MSSPSIIQYVEQEWGRIPHFLIVAILEWIMILFLFINGFLAFIATLFAKFFGLPVPCVLCTRFDSITFRKKSSFCYNECACEDHKKEISHLAYCHVHKKLSDIRRMCEGCLLSFATEKESDCDTYKSLVGLLQKDVVTLIDDDQTRCSHARRRVEDVSRVEIYQCSCCGSRLRAKVAHTKANDATTPGSKRKLERQVSRLAKAPLSSPKTPFRHSMRENLGSLQLPHIKYMELKLTPGSETIEDDYTSTVIISGKGDTTAATMPLLTEEDESQTPSKGNTFFGIPLTDSTSSTPKWGNNNAHKKSPFEKCDSSWEPSEEHAAEDDIILHHLKRQVRLDRKSLIDMYMELDEERSASAVAANNSMAMITRLQAEKEAIQMEALQYQRMMEEQAEYDQENFHAMKELATKREDEIKALKVELDIYRQRYGLISVEDVHKWYSEFQGDSFSEESESFRSRDTLSQETEDGHSS